jgi:hypothetical protein
MDLRRIVSLIMGRLVFDFLRWTNSYYLYYLCGFRGRDPTRVGLLVVL